MKIVRLVLGILSLTLSLPAHAVGFICPPAPITYLSANMQGDVYVSAGYGHILICNSRIDSMGATAEACRLWYSTLLTAYITGQSASLSFDTGNPDNAGLTPNVCTETNFGNFTTRPTYYVYVGS